jgi:CvfB-like winged helix domain/SAP domain
MLSSASARKFPRLLIVFALVSTLCRVSSYVTFSRYRIGFNSVKLVRIRATFERYEDLTVVQLKEILRERGLQVSGVKSELVRRLTEASGSQLPAARGHLIGDSNELGGNNIEEFGERKLSTTPQIKVKKGEIIDVQIVKYGALGASVQVMKKEDKETHQSLSGLILKDQLEYWVALNGREPRVGEVIRAYVQRLRDDGKIDFALRPVGYDKVTEARDRILSALESSRDGTIPVGDKSTPEDIWAHLPGMSKGQFKAGVGALLREGAIQTSEFLLTLVPAEERVPMTAQPYSGKSPRGWLAPEGSTVFVGNLPFTIDNMR